MQFQTPTAPANEVEIAEETALLAAHFRALRRLHSAVEHLLRSPLNSIGLNLELLAAEIADRAGENGAAPAVMEEVLAALRKGYERLVESTDTILETAVSKSSERIEALDLAQLTRRIAGLGATESVLLRASWQTEIPAGPLSIGARREHLVSALLQLVCAGLRQAGRDSRILLFLRPEAGAVKVGIEVDPRLDAERPGGRPEDRLGLQTLAPLLGGSLAESTEERAFRLHLSLPRFLGAAAC